MLTLILCMMRVFSIFPILLLLLTMPAHGDVGEASKANQAIGSLGTTFLKIKGGLEILQDVTSIKDDADKTLMVAKAFRTASALSNVLGVAGGIFSLVLIFIPTGPSAEMREMKKSFAKVFRALEEMERHIDLLGERIELEAQRAVLRGHVEKINFADKMRVEMFEQLEKLQHSRTDNSSTIELQREQLKIAANYVKYLDVKFDVFALLRQEHSPGSVLTPIHDLISRTFECHVPKLLSYKAGILAAAIKGQAAVEVHSRLQGYRTTEEERTSEWTDLARQFEDQVNGVVLSCLDDMNSQVTTVVSKGIYQTMTNTKARIEIANVLQARFPWMDWVVVSYEGQGFFFKRKYGGYTYDPNDNEKRVLIALPMTAYPNCTKWLAKSFNRDLKNFIPKVKISDLKKNAVNGLVYSTVTKNNLNFFAVTHLFEKEPLKFYRRGAWGSVVIGDFDDEDYKYVIAGDRFSNCANDPVPACDGKYCSGRGKCIKLVRSARHLCDCEKEYSGERCQIKIEVSAKWRSTDRFIWKHKF